MNLFGYKLPLTEVIVTPHVLYYPILNASLQDFTLDRC